MLKSSGPIIYLNTESMRGCYDFKKKSILEGLLNGRPRSKTIPFFTCHLFLPPGSAVEVIESVPSVCPSVCLSVSTLAAESYLSILHGKRTFWQKGCACGERGRYLNAQAFSLFCSFHGDEIIRHIEEHCWNKLIWEWLIYFVNPLWCKSMNFKITSQGDAAKKFTLKINRLKIKQ